MRSSVVKFSRAFLYLTSILLLSSCAGTQMHLRMLERDGTIRVDHADNSNFDYKVYIKNTTDIGWNGDDQKDRVKYVNMMFHKRCANLEIIEEKSIETGTYAFNRPAVTWVMSVKCQKNSQ
jgi:hypothetical protein